MATLLSLADSICLFESICLESTLPSNVGGRLGRIYYILVHFPQKNIKDRLEKRFEARINQDSMISAQLTLWDQRGSQVIGGNLLVIPLDNALKKRRRVAAGAQAGDRGDEAIS